MASIPLTIIRRTGYLDIGAILRVRCFHLRRREHKNEFLFPTEISPRCLLGGGAVEMDDFWHCFLSRHISAPEI